MLRFFVDRLVRLVLVLIAITVVSFLFMHAIPGDPVILRLGEHASPQEAAHLRAQLGLDRPWFVQLALYLVAVAHGDLGASVFDAQPVSLKLAQYFPATLELTLGAMLFAVIVGVPAAGNDPASHSCATRPGFAPSVAIGEPSPVAMS